MWNNRKRKIDYKDLSTIYNKLCCGTLVLASCCYGGDNV